MGNREGEITVYLKVGEADAPAGGCVEFTGVSTGGYPEVRRPTTNSTGRAVACLLEDLTAGKAGKAIMGFSPVAHYTGMFDVGKRMGSTANDYHWSFYSGGGSAVPIVDFGSNYCSLFFSKSGVTELTQKQEVNQAAPITNYALTTGQADSYKKYGASEDKMILVPFESTAQTAMASGTVLKVMAEWYAEFESNCNDGTQEYFITKISQITAAWDPTTVTWDTKPASTILESMGVTLLTRNGSQTGSLRIVDYGETWGALYQQITLTADSYGLAFSVSIQTDATSYTLIDGLSRINGIFLL